MRTIKRRVLKVKCPVCKSLIEIEPEELKMALLNIYIYMDDDYLGTKVFKAFCCPECNRAIYKSWFGWRDWNKKYGCYN